MHRCLKVLAALTIGLLASLPGIEQPLRAGEPNSVTAIDILLEPDATMIEHAKAANQRLLKGFPIRITRTSRVCSGTLKQPISTSFTRPSVKFWLRRGRPPGS
jgi:hypothetical protein